MKPIETFVCIPLNSARLTRESCAARHLRALRKGEKGVLGFITGTCVRCGIGAQHAKGERPRRWEDGKRIETRRVLPVVGRTKVATREHG